MERKKCICLCTQTDVPVKLNILKGRRSTSEFVDCDTGACIGNHRWDILRCICAIYPDSTALQLTIASVSSFLSLEDERSVITARSTGSRGDKKMYQTVARKFEDLRKKLASKREQLRSQIYYTSNAYESMQHILARVQGTSWLIAMPANICLLSHFLVARSVQCRPALLCT